MGSEELEDHIRNQGSREKFGRDMGKKQKSLKHEVLYEEFCSELFACNIGMLRLKWQFKCCQ